MNGIKFSGKRLDNGEWVYGDLLQDCGGSDMFIASRYHVSGNFVQAFFDAVDPETIGQYIGLKAKNVEIYVGSIIDQFNNRFVVESCPGGYQLGVYYNKRLCCGRQGTYNIAALATDYCETIGNIHDNPELLSIDREGGNYGK